MGSCVARGELAPVSYLLAKARAAEAAGAEYLILPSCHVKKPKTGGEEGVGGGDEGVARGEDQGEETLDGTEVEGLQLIPVSNLYELVVAALTPKDGCHLLQSKSVQSLIQFLIYRS